MSVIYAAKGLSNTKLEDLQEIVTLMLVFAKVIRQSFKEAMNQNDTLISPAAPSAAYKIGEKKNDPLVKLLSHTSEYVNLTNRVRLILQLLLLNFIGGYDVFVIS
ncbi:glutamyl-tRNA(Gln) amidotransferase subunit A chloroplastic/mitochondrial-like [Trifolium medium]|uniref:Glutamyl-tRNA(Gln) amidotransferase subunit A chloroplastic/mitochondrial-like n=1 Tax=Trifolium medium TaxID=97028 RepID=A0A392M6Q2_9FABA|nr:glutamyl-tRNA(Gln) amidotransferase subunit A chloroplastic/mitochondrial-like [Trifolium medium]